MPLLLELGEEILSLCICNRNCIIIVIIIVYIIVVVAC